MTRTNIGIVTSDTTDGKKGVLSMKYEIKIIRSKYSAWNTDPAMGADTVEQLEEILKAIKAGGNYGACISFADGGDDDDF